MNQRNIAEEVFVLLDNAFQPAYREEGNMIMDTFLEEDFTMGECKRLLLYLLDKVQEERYEALVQRIEAKIGSLHEQED